MLRHLDLWNHISWIFSCISEYQAEVNSQHCTNVLWFIGEEVGLTMGHQHHQATEPAAIGTWCPDWCRREVSASGA